MQLTLIDTAVVTVQKTMSGYISHNKFWKSFKFMAEIGRNITTYKVLWYVQLVNALGNCILYVVH